MNISSTDISICT